MNLRRELLLPGSASHRVLYCHQVSEEPSAIYPEGLTPREFERRIRFLRSAGFRYISLSEAVQARIEGNRTAYTASVSIDDGLASVYHTIFPQAKMLEIPLTLFLIGKCIDNRALAWNHKLILIRRQADPDQLWSAVRALVDKYRLRLSADLGSTLFSVPMERKEELADELWRRFMNTSEQEYLAQEKPYITKEQLLELAGQGVELASHSYSHPDCNRLSYDELVYEILQSQDVIRPYAANPVNLFAFPYARICDPSLLRKLSHDTGIEAFFGGRFTLLDNRGSSLLWQRQKLELPFRQFIAEVSLKPGLRAGATLLGMKG